MTKRRLIGCIRKLETYRIPRSLVGKKTQSGEIQKRLYPIFRDREELPTANELASVIKNALEESSHLIVICSLQILPNQNGLMKR